MVSVNATAKSALAALQIIRPKAEVSDLTKPLSTPTFEPVTQVRLAPGVSDAIMKIGQIVNSTRIADLPADHADQLRAFGADSAVRVSKPSVSEEDFQSSVMTYVKENWIGLEGFSEALANGTVKIQRASDVKGLGYETIQYDLFKDGSPLGHAGWDTINRSFYDAQAAAGVRQGIGSINGQDFYVTW